MPTSAAPVATPVATPVAPSLVPQPAHPSAATPSAPGPSVPAPPAVISTAGKYFSPNPVPTGDQVLDVDLRATGTSWLLLSVHCTTGRCVQLANSTDQGRSWHRLPTTAIDAADWPPQCPPSCSVQRVRFVSATDGYLFAPGLYLTTDGGRSWHDAHPTAATDGIGLVGTVVVRAVSGWCQKTADSCTSSLQYAQAGSNSWTTATTPPLGYPYGLSLHAQDGGGTAYVVRGDNMAGGVAYQPLVLRSHDGRTWQAVPDPCAGDGKETVALATEADRVVVLCMRHGGDAGTNLRSSSDDGAHFSGPTSVTVTWAGGVALQPGDTLVASGPTSGNGPLALQVAFSPDNGLHWQTVAATHIALTALGASLGLTADSTNDVAWLVTPVEVWFSHDAGRTWTHVAAADI